MTVNPTPVALLRNHLQGVVPLYAHEFLTKQRELIMPRPDLAAYLGANGDAIIYRSPGRTAKAITILCEAIATMAFCPGGVNFVGLHFEVVNTAEAGRQLLIRDSGESSIHASYVSPPAPEKDELTNLATSLKSATLGEQEDPRAVYLDRKTRPGPHKDEWNLSNLYPPIK